MTEFNITGVVSSNKSRIDFSKQANDEYVAVMLSHGPNNIYDIPIYFEGYCLEKARSTRLTVGDVIKVEGVLKSRRVLSKVRNKNKNVEVSQIRLIPVATDFIYIERSGAGRVIRTDYLSKLLAIEEIGGSIE